MQHTHTLYRFYAADDALLYIGITCNPGHRIANHRSVKEWWLEVARIEMEQHPDRTSLPAAERAAIHAEKPLYNVLMKARATGEKTTEEQDRIGLVGKWFHSPSDAGGIEWQGEILDRIDDFYLIQTYSWWTGEATKQRLVSLHAIGVWTFYENPLEMQKALGCQEHDKTICARPVTHRTGGGSLVCSGCATYYADVEKL